MNNINYDDEKTEIVSLMVNICTRVITSILIIAPIIMKFAFHYSNLALGFADIWGIILIGVVSGASFGIFFIKKNMTKVQQLICHVLYFLILNAVVLFSAIKFAWIDKELFHIMVIEIIFVLIYLVVRVLVFAIDFNEAKKINQKLKNRRKGGVTRNE